MHRDHASLGAKVRVLHETVREVKQLATAVISKPKRGRPGRAVLPCVPARNKATALRNRRIKAAYNRKRNPLTQQQVAERYHVDQSIVSVVLRNPCSDKTDCDC